jgi:hypothetical protein
MKPSYNKASSKKKKELKKDLENLDKKIDRLESQISAEKKRIQNETLRLRREIQQLNININRKKSTLGLKEEYIRYDVSKLKKRVGYQETLTAVRDEERDIASGYADALTSIARALDVASIISPVSVFDICSAYTGKDCVDDEDVTKFGKVFVYGSLVPVGGKVLKVNKITKNGKKVLEALEVGKIITKSPSLSSLKVSDSKLKNLIDDLYKGAGSPRQIGAGSTADAIRNELKTGLLTEGKSHSQKGREYINALNNWLKNNANASDADRNIAEKLKQDLLDALDSK